MEDYIFERQCDLDNVDGEAENESGSNYKTGYKSLLEGNELFRQYIDSIKDIIPPSVSEERTLVERIQSGDSSAKSELISRNMKLVVHMACKTYSGSKEKSNLCIELMDLIQEGNLALTKAVDTYQLDKGARFSTYAGICIKYAISNFFRESVPIKPPRNNGYVAVGPKPEIPRVVASLQETFTGGKINSADEDATELICYIEDPDENTEEKITNKYDFDNLIERIHELPYRLRHYMSVRWGIVDGIVREEKDMRSLFNLTAAEFDELERESLDELRNGYAEY